MKKYIMITGSTDGIGLQTAIEFSKAGKNLIIHGRNNEKLAKAKNILLSHNRNIDIVTVCADFSKLKEVKNAFSSIKHLPINVLINNAACFSNTHTITDDGFEMTYQVNHLSPFLLTIMLTDTLIKNAPSKIIIVSSMAHAQTINFDSVKTGDFSYSYQGYSDSKLCNILVAFKFASILKDKNISVNCIHPGVVNTKLLTDNWGACGIPVENGYKMIMYAYNLPNDVSGNYLKDFKIAQAANIAYNTKVQDRCYEISMNQIAKYL